MLVRAARTAGVGRSGISAPRRAVVPSGPARGPSSRCRLGPRRGRCETSGHDARPRLVGRGGVGPSGGVRGRRMPTARVARPGRPTAPRPDFITQPSVIDQILTHLRTRAATAAHADARSPPSTRGPSSRRELPRGWLPGSESLHIGGGERLTPDGPIAAADLLDDTPRH